MSSLPPDALAALNELLGNLTSANNSLRAQAEETLNNGWIQDPKHREMLLVGLTEMSVGGETTMLRSFAAVLFRRVSGRLTANGTSILDEVSDASLERIKQLLLQGLVAEDQANDVRHKISDSISKVALPGTKSGDNWPQLLATLFQASKHTNAQVRESSFRIFAAVPDIIGENLVGSVLPVFESGFADESVGVRISTVTAFASFFEALPKSTWPVLHPLLPNMLSILTPLREAGDERAKELSSVLESLIDLADRAPKMFKPMFKTIIEFCDSLAKDRDADESPRLDALELATTFAERAPGMCKHEPSYAPNMIIMCLAMMTEVGIDDDDGADWNNSDDINETDDADKIEEAARQSIDRLALKLGGSQLLGPLFTYLPTMLATDDWRQRHAALMALSTVAEGCRDEMILEFGKILEMILPALRDPHSRVQWAACNALGQMSTDFADYVQNHFGPQILPALISKLANDSTPRVQAHAAAALVNFSESATKEVLDPYLDSLLSALLVLLQSPKRYVQEQVLTTIAIVADSAQNKFDKYYDTLMGMLLHVMKADTGVQERLLKAKSIECSTLIALAVGKERFAPHCEELVTTFAKIQQNITDDDDPCQSYLVHAWGRLCRVLGTDFIPYLNGVMPQLLNAAKAAAEVRLVESQDEVDDLENDGWDVIPVKGKHLAIHTSVLDEKESAIELISVYASELKAYFAPYVKEVVSEVIIPSINFFYHDEVRYVTAQAVPHLLTCVRAASEASGANPNMALLELWTPILKKMLSTLMVDEVVENVTAFYSSIYQSVDIIGPSALSGDDMQQLVESINRSLGEYMERVKSRTEGNQDDFTEDVDEGDSEYYDEELLGELNKAVHSVIKAESQAFLPAFEGLIPVLTSFINSSVVDCRQWALCVVDDLIEFVGPESWKYKDIFIQKLVDGLLDGDASVRQACAYGIGVAAQNGGEPYVQTVVGCLNTLFKVANVPEARSEENLHVTENVCTAIAKILRKHGQFLGGDLDKAISEWIKTLPIVVDDEAAPFAYLFLSDLMAQNHVAATSQPDRVFSAVAQALVANSLQGKTAAKVVEVTKQFLGGLPSDQAMGFFQSLPVDSQQVVQRWFQ